jgi:chromosome segregation ATPase
MSALVIGVLFCVYFDVSVGSPEMEAIKRLERKVNDLQENSRIQEQKISVIMFENDKLKRRMSEMSAENIKMKEDISALQKQNQHQSQINSELTIELAEMHKSIKTFFQTKENGALRSSGDGLNRSHKVKNNITKPPTHDSFWDDLQTTNASKQQSTKQQLAGTELIGSISLQNKGLRRLVSPGIVHVKVVDVCAAQPWTIWLE